LPSFDSARRQRDSSAKAVLPKATPSPHLLLSSPASTIQRSLQETRGLTPSAVQTLQRKIGNRAVVQLLAKDNQPDHKQRPSGRLKVGPARDRFEQEADSVAEQVSGHRSEHSQHSAPPAPQVQRSSIGPEGGVVSSDVEQKLRQHKQGGQAIPMQVQRAVSQVTGYDYRNVRVHNDGKAHALNSQLNAKAFTHDNHIFLGKGQSASDLHLMAHELTHTVQQGAVQRAPDSTHTAKTGPTRVSGGAKQLQRFSIDEPFIKWKDTTTAKRSSDGATGVLFVKDGSGNTIVLKASRDPVGETFLANVMHEKISGAQTVQTREVTGDRISIASHVLPKVQIAEQDRKSLNGDYMDTNNRLWAFGLAAGKNFKSIARDDPTGQFMKLIKDHAYLERLGRVAAVDIFMGNHERLNNKNIANTGNWMTDDSGNITVIDNYDTATQANIRRGHQRYEKRKQQKAQGQQPDDWARADMTYWGEMDKLAPSRIGKTAYNLCHGMLRDIWFEIDITNNNRKKVGAPPITVPYQQSEMKEMATQMAPHLEKGLKAGRKELIRKLSPSIGKRSRSIKAEVVGRQGGLGKAGWKDLKKRARYLRDLQSGLKKPGRWQV
jgi:hypothetical protein